MKQHLSTCSCSRRSFLSGGGLTLAGFGLASLFPGPLIDHVLASTAANDKRLLFIFMRGGNDGVNTVIPHGDADYNTTTRQTLYISPGQAVDLNGFASLHPALGDLMDVFDAGELAVLHRIGYPDSSLSHFDAQRTWENGDPSQPKFFEGWLYRYLVENAPKAGVDLPALSVQSSPPLILNGEERFVNVANTYNFDYLDGDPKRSKYAGSWRNLYEDLMGLESYRPVLSQTGVNLVDILDEYRSWEQHNWNPLDPATGHSLFPVDNATNPPDPSGPGGLKFPASAYGFFRSLKVCALSLLESEGGDNNNGTRVAGTQIGGFDLHDGQAVGGDPTAGSHATQLAQLGYGLRSLKIVLSGQANDPRNYPGIWDKTVVTTMSEFGRTSRENGSFGTDHAAASCMFVEGGGVNGGVYNCDPSTWEPGVLFAINNNYLSQRTDYRSVFWEIMRDHMGAPTTQADTVFPAYTALNLGAQELGLVDGGPTDELPYDPYQVR